MKEAIAAHDEKQAPHEGKRYASTAGFFLAMSLCRQGEGIAAREAFRLAAAQMGPCLSDKQPLLNNNDNVGEPIDVWLAHQEAAKMLGPEAEPAAKNPKGQRCLDLAIFC